MKSMGNPENTTAALGAAVKSTINVNTNFKHAGMGAQTPPMMGKPNTGGWMKADAPAKPTKTN